MTEKLIDGKIGYLVDGIVASQMAALVQVLYVHTLRLIRGRPFMIFLDIFTSYSPIAVHTSEKHRTSIDIAKSD